MEEEEGPEEVEADEAGPEEEEEGPAGEGDGRMWEGGADGGGMSMLTEGLFDPGVCCYTTQKICNTLLPSYLFRGELRKQKLLSHQSSCF